MQSINNNRKNTTTPNSEAIKHDTAKDLFPYGKNSLAFHPVAHITSAEWQDRLSPTEKARLARENERISPKGKRKEPSPTEKKRNPLYDEVITDRNLWRIARAIAVSCLKGNYQRAGNEVTRVLLSDCIRAICVANREPSESIKDTLNGLDCVQEVALALTPYRGEIVETRGKKGEITRRVIGGKRCCDTVKDAKGNEVTLRILAFRACNTYIHRQARDFIELKLDNPTLKPTAALQYTIDEFTRQVDDGDELANFLSEVCEIMQLGREQKAVLYLKYSTMQSNADIARTLGKTPAAISKLIAKIKTRLLNNFGIAERTIASNSEGIEECQTLVCGAVSERADGRYEWNGADFLNLLG